MKWFFVYCKYEYMNIIYNYCTVRYSYYTGDVLNYFIIHTTAIGEQLHRDKYVM